MVLLVSPSELKRAPDDLIAPEMSFGAVHVPLMFGPNITGKTSIPVNHSYAGHYMVAGSNGWDTAAEIDVDCLLEKSAIYGGSTTVQPASLRVLPCIKS